MEQPLVSILMVNYNQEKFLTRAIESVINQTYKNWELIIVDDGSTDRSIDIIKHFADKDERICCYPQKENSQICVVTNIGFQHLKGEFIARLDSDDIWVEDKLEKQLAYMNEHIEGALCFTKLDLINEREEIINQEQSELYKLFNKRQENRKEWIRFFFYYGNSLIQSTLLMRREVLDKVGGFNLAYRQGHDFDFFVRAIVKYDFLFLEEPLVKYRRSEKQNSSLDEENNRRFYNEHMSIRYHFFDEIPDELFKEVFREDFMNKESNTPQELMCEKAFLLCKSNHEETINPILGVHKLEELMRNPEMVGLLKNKYHYTPKEFYKKSGCHLFYSHDDVIKNSECMWEIAQLEHERNHLKKVQEEQYFEIHNLKDNINQLQTVVAQQRQLIDEIKSSKGWKMINSLRRIKRGIKRN